MSHIPWHLIVNAIRILHMKRNSEWRYSSRMTGIMQQVEWKIVRTHNDHQQDLQLLTQRYELINLLQGQPLQQIHIAAPWLPVKPDNSNTIRNMS